MADKRTFLYYTPRELEQATAYKASHPRTMLRSYKGFDPADMDGRAGDRVLCTDSAQVVVAAYAAIGVEVEVLAPDMDPAAPEAPNASHTLPKGYEVKQTGPWYKLIGPDGQQVGKACRSAEEAAAQYAGG